MKPKILVLTGTWPQMPCGISAYLARVLGRLARLDRFELAVLTSADSRVNSGAVTGCRVIPTINDWSPGNSHAIVESVLAQTPDLVFIQAPTAGYPGWRARVMNRVARGLKLRVPQMRLCLFLHDLAVSHPLTRWRFDGLLRAMDGVIVSNSRDRRAVRARGIAEGKIHQAPFSSYFPPALRDPASRQAARARLGIPAGAVCLVYFGFVLPGRQIETLLRATRRLLDQGRRVHTLLLGGPHSQCPDYYEQCRQLALRLDLAEQTTWTGYASDEQVADGMAAADIFVSLPKRGADMRNTSILTGILAGLPVITCRNDRYYHDEELDRFGCVMVPPGRPRAVAQAVAGLIDHPADPAELARRAGLLEPERVWSRHIEILLQAFGVV